MFTTQHSSDESCTTIDCLNWDVPEGLIFDDVEQKALLVFELEKKCRYFSRDICPGSALVGLAV